VWCDGKGSEKGEAAKRAQAAEAAKSTEGAQAAEGGAYSSDTTSEGGATQAAGMGLTFPVTIVTHRSTAQPGQVPEHISGWSGIGKNCSECAGVLPTGSQNLAFRHVGQWEVMASP